MNAREDVVHIRHLAIGNYDEFKSSAMMASITDHEN